MFILCLFTLKKKKKIVNLFYNLIYFIIFILFVYFYFLFLFYFLIKDLEIFEKKPSGSLMGIDLISTAHTQTG